MLVPTTALGLTMALTSTLPAAWALSLQEAPQEGCEHVFAKVFGGVGVERDVSESGAAASRAPSIIGSGPGAAYVFTRGGTTWSQTQKLVAPAGANGDSFGEHMTLSGGVLAVGAAVQVHVERLTRRRAQQGQRFTPGIAVALAAHEVVAAGQCCERP